MTNPTADAAKPLPERSDVFNPDELPIMIRVLERDPPVLLRHDTMRAAVLYLNAELVKANTRPQPAPPDGEPDFEKLGNYLIELVKGGVSATWVHVELERMYRLGLAARPKVEDGEVEAAITYLGDEVPEEKAIADLLERLAGEAQNWWASAIVAMKAQGAAETKLAEREADLADMDWLYALHCKAFPPSITESGKAVKIIDAYAARQQQKALIEPATRERR